ADNFAGIGEHTRARVLAFTLVGHCQGMLECRIALSVDRQTGTVAVGARAAIAARNQQTLMTTMVRLAIVGHCKRKINGSARRKHKIANKSSHEVLYFFS